MDGNEVQIVEEVPQGIALSTTAILVAKYWKLGIVGIFLIGIVSSYFYVSHLHNKIDRLETKITTIEHDRDVYKENADACGKKYDSLSDGIKKVSTDTQKMNDSFEKWKKEFTNKTSSNTDKIRNDKIPAGCEGFIEYAIDNLDKVLW